MGERNNEETQSLTAPATNGRTPSYGDDVSDAEEALSRHNGREGRSDDNSDEPADETTTTSTTGAAAAVGDGMPVVSIVAILSTAFSYGCVFTTLFLITLPIECERISATPRGGVCDDGNTHHHTSKSVALGIFVAIAGFTQLVSPIVGRISDTYEPPRIGYQIAEIGQRMPYYFLGAILAVFGLLGQMVSSYAALWLRYGFCFVFSMTGLNIQYAMMIALIPDQVPRHQVGVTNGILALLLVLGSLFGFGLFHSSILAERVGGMYALYACINVATTLLTMAYAHDKDATITANRILHSASKRRRTSGTIKEDSLRGSSGLNTAEQPMSWPKKARHATKRAVRKAKQIVLTPAIVVKSMVEPLLDIGSLYQIYTIDTEQYHDFYIVTISRLFYYCGMSVQTFFLYFVHDIVHVRTNPEAAVATLAILGQCSAALTCYPVGYISDRYGGRRRKPFVYVACALLGTTTLAMSMVTTFHQMVILSLILGAANGMYLTMETSLAVDTLPEDDGTESAQLLGIWGVAAFLGSALGPMVGGPLLSMFRDHNNNATELADDTSVPEEYSRAGYALVYVLSALYFSCSALALCYIRDKP